MTFTELNDLLVLELSPRGKFTLPTMYKQSKQQPVSRLTNLLMSSLWRLLNSLHFHCTIRTLTIIHWKPCRHISQHRVRSISFRKLSAYCSSCSILIFFHASSKFFLSLGWLATCLMGNTTLRVEFDWFNSEFSLRCAVGKTDAKGVDLYDGGTGDIRPRLSVSEVIEDSTGLSALVGEGIEKSKSFEFLALISGLFTKGLRFACAGSRFIARRNDRGDSWESSSSKMWSIRPAATGVSDRRDSRSSVTDLKVWLVGTTEYC